MKFRTAILLIINLFYFSVAYAHGPTPQKIDEHITIVAPASEVWKKLADFSAITEWHPMVEGVDMIDDMTRRITMKDKGQLTESLDELDQERHYIAYRLLEEDIKVFPVSYYSISIELSADEAGTNVLWQGRFYRADTGNFPPEHFSDAAAVKAMVEFARAGMTQLKTDLENK